jgi:hypothetical protein
MADTINRVGHIMRLQTVGEFAESTEVISELRALGVDFAHATACNDRRFCHLQWPKSVRRARRRSTDRTARTPGWPVRRSNVPAMGARPIVGEIDPHVDNRPSPLLVK